MTYSEAIDYMFAQLPMFHRVGKSAYKANLDTAEYFDTYFQNPHRNYKTIHVAGTNGKGSVSHSLAAILQSAGYKTGLFTSPHLKDFRERIRINGQMISENEIVDFIEKHKNVFEEIRPSFFEMTSALAFDYFNRENVDIAVIEVGMGGRLDSTNVIQPILSVITNIGFDHTEFLGDTLAKIAREKAGIIKAKTPVIIGEYHEETFPVFSEIASGVNSKITVADQVYFANYSLFGENGHQIFQINKLNVLALPNLKLDLAGFYQRKNICTVLASVDELRNNGYTIPNDALYQGLDNVTELTGLQGRWQTLGNNPLVICDTGHNKDGMSWIIQQIKSVPYKKLHIVIGFVKDKDVTSILSMLPKDALYYFTNANIPRALHSDELAKLAEEYELHGNSYSTVNQALEAAKVNAGIDDFIFIGGSTFVVAEVV